MTGLARVRAHVAAGDLRAARSALLEVTDAGWEELELRLGRPAVAKLRQGLRSGKRAYRGRVVVMHGIMGGRLATRDRTGDEDLVWVDYLRLVAGRIEDFRLDDDGNQADPTIDVVTRGLLDEYLPLLFELEGTWEVLPFAFDWRLDIGQSADRLDEAIREWAGGEPAHIVAHSMGGLVARQFIKSHSATWRSMAYPDGQRRGGRLVMLGTPNRGSFAMPFVLSGEEQTVRMLRTLDLRHNLAEILEIIDTFVGSYQMMPSPLHDFGDDRMKLYREAAWGSFPVTQRRLDTGRHFQEDLDEVIDADRLVYVAGYDQETPYRVRVDAPGRFSYQLTNDGDGRVPHELGELPGVRTFYVREVHGDLPSNEAVLAGIHDLLMTGATARLESHVPADKRGVARSRVWRKASEIAPLPPEVAGVLGAGRGVRLLPKVASRTTQVLLEQALVGPFVGASRTSRVQPATAQPPLAASQARKGKSSLLDIEVMWGDICLVDGEIYAAGHYQGVVPQFGERALDRRVSGIAPGKRDFDERDLVITALTRRGQVRAAVGDVSFYPWMGESRKAVAIAGMGHPGTFGKRELQRLVRSLTEHVSMLPGVKVVNTLMIGAGVGNLPIPAAVDAMLNGVIDALRGGAAGRSTARIRIVERDWARAREIFAALKRLKADRKDDLAFLELGSRVAGGKGGTYSDEIALSALLAAVVKRRTPGGRGASVAQALMGDLPPKLRRSAVDVLKRVRLEPDEPLPANASLLAIAESLKLARGAARATDGGMASRFSFISEEGGVRAAAIAHSAVVPERMVAFDWGLLDELVTRMTDPEDVASIAQDAALLANFVVPPDFRDEMLRSSATIFEVDRRTARIPWEMLGKLDEETTSARPMALEGCVARQLRTTYSPPPARAPVLNDPLRALVIGDPGSGRFALPEARHEALEVTALMRSYGLEVTTLLGPPDLEGKGEHPEFPPATILAVLGLLVGQFDILHFAGHGDFDPADPARAGWLFGDGKFLTARELGSAYKVPRLVVANACISGVLSDVAPPGTAPKSQAERDADLLPGLADEFFKRGVRNYVGTAWPISDVGAVHFATAMYRSLLDPAGAATLGDALLTARRDLNGKETMFGALWAAYRHYGDPGLRLVGSAQPQPRKKRGARKGGRR